MADLFTLFGTISVNADSANRTIDNTTTRAGGLSKAFDKVGSAAVKVGKTVAAGMAAGAAGVGVLLKSSISSYAEYEQLVGGIDTLFKDSNTKVMEYASNAYKTAGLSANKYMETVTSFSASLLQGLGGDTAKAVDVADMAVTDMADNANKMGTSIDMIQNAYQGFAKQNYTMLDNLKLGYGGTASEMARLINDSGVMGKKFKATAKNLKDIPFDKQIEAIHEMQVRMGVAGTTAAEASETISGSWASLGAAWENLLVGMNDSQADMDALFDNIFVAAENVANNLGKLLPSLTRNVGKLLTNVAKFAGKKLQSAWENTIYPYIKDAFKIAFGIDLPDWETVKTTISTKWAEVKAAFDEGGLTKAFAVILPDWATITTNISDGWNNIIWPVVQKIFSTVFRVDLPSWATLVTDISNGWNNDVWPEIQGFFKQEFGITLPDWESIKTEATTKMQEISTAIQPTMDTISGLFATVSTKASEFVGWLSGTSESATNFKAALWGVSAALLVFSVAMGIKGIIDGVTTAISAAKAAFALFNSTLLANPILLIIASIAGLIVALTYLYNHNETVRTAIDTAWNAIKTTFETVTGAIKTAIQTVIDAWNSLMELLGGSDSQDPGGGSTSVNTRNGGEKKGGGYGKSFGEGEVTINASEDSEGNVQADIASWLLEGDAVIEADPSSKTKLQSFLNGLDLTATVTLKPDASGLGGYDGSHAGGLDRVPFDGYRALLHKDEMVLTAAQARNYRRGESAGASTANRTRNRNTDYEQPINVTLNITGVSSNPYEIAGEVRNALELLRWQS